METAVAVKVEAKVEMARTDDMMAVATMMTTPTVSADAPIGHTAITGMAHARGTMGNVVKAMTCPLPNQCQSTRRRPFHHADDGG